MYDVPGLKIALVAELERLGLRYEVDIFPSGVVMIHVWRDPEKMVVIQMHESEFGLSLVAANDPGFSNLPDRSYCEPEAFLRAAFRLFDTFGWENSVPASLTAGRTVKRWLSILGFHASVLFILLLLAIDPLRAIVGQTGLISGTAKILVFGFVGALLQKTVSSWAAQENRSRLLLAVSMLYLPLTYAALRDIIMVRITDADSRASVQQKISANPVLAAGGWKGSGLHFEEYAALRRELRMLREIPPEADSIGFAFAADGFLPDYQLEISYLLPKSVPAAAFNRDTGRSEWRQRVQHNGEKNRVFYFEGLR